MDDEISEEVAEESAEESGGLFDKIEGMISEIDAGEVDDDEPEEELVEEPEAEAEPVESKELTELRTANAALMARLDALEKATKEPEAKEPEAKEEEAPDFTKMKPEEVLSYHVDKAIDARLDELLEAKLGSKIEDRLGPLKATADQAKQREAIVNDYIGALDGEPEDSVFFKDEGAQMVSAIVDGTPWMSEAAKDSKQRPLAIRAAIQLAKERMQVASKAKENEDRSASARAPSASRTGGSGRAPRESLMTVVKREIKKVGT